MAPADKRLMVAYGLWGSCRGLKFSQNILQRVQNILVHYTPDFVRNVSLQGLKEDGSESYDFTESSYSGKKATYILEDGEILVGISGYYGNVSDEEPVVTSLTFHTNRRTYGPVGAQKGKPFSCNPGGGIEILSIYGDCDNHENPSMIYSVGIYCKLSASIFDPDSKLMMLPSLASFYNDAARTLKSAEWKPWPSTPLKFMEARRDDGIYCGVRQISIKHQVGYVVSSIRVQYEDINGNQVWGVKHGKGYSSGDTETITFDYPNEYLVGIDGNVTSSVKSITFHTNKKKYGPFGKGDGNYFSTPLEGFKVLGICTVYGHYVDRIGVHLAVHESVKRDDMQEQLEKGWFEFASRIMLQKVLAGTTKPNA